MGYDLGQRVILSAEWRNQAGTLTNPITVTLEVLTPDDEPLSPTPTITNPSTGLNEAILPLTLPGQWAWRWTAQGNGVDQVAIGTIEVDATPFGGADAYDDEPDSDLHDELRLRLGDTDQANPILTEAQLAWLLTQTAGDVGAAAIKGARLLSARFAGKADEDIAEGDVRRKVSWSKLADSYAKLADNLAAEVATDTGTAVAVAAVPLAGGLRFSDLDGRDPDLIDPYFSTSPTVGIEDLWRRLA